MSTEHSTLEDEMSRNVGHQSPRAAASHHRRMKTKAYTLNLPLCKGVGCDLTWIKFCKTIVITTKLSSELFKWRDCFLWNAFISRRVCWYCEMIIQYINCSLLFSITYTKSAGVYSGTIITWMAVKKVVARSFLLFPVVMCTDEPSHHLLCSIML
jgi:hypothetical protein